MKMRLWGVGNLPRLSDPKKRIVTLTTLLACISVSLFIVTELITVVAAAFWAVSEMLVLPPVITVAFSALLGVPTVWVAMAIVILVFNAETDPENNQDTSPTTTTGEDEPGTTSATRIAY